MNPDQLDFGTLEDPDEVFRLFGVRDVRGLEKRAGCVCSIHCVLLCMKADLPMTRKVMRQLPKLPS
jgi:hypothetical protein